MSNRCFNFTVTEKLFFKNLRGTRGPLHSGAPGLCPPCPPHCCATGLGIAVSSPSGFGRSPATKRIYVHFEVKLKHFRVLTVQLVHCTYDCVGVIGGPTHWWTPAGQILGGPDPYEPCSVWLYIDCLKDETA